MSKLQPWLQKYSNEQIEHGTHEYVTYYKGDKETNIILLAAHGGNFKPNTITNRSINNEKQPKPAKLSYIGDIYTQQISLLLQEELERLTTKKPHVIACNLHRAKLDANRDLFIAAFDEPEAVKAFHEFHAFIDTAKSSIQQGIVFDIHGHTHPEEWVELGYCLSNKEICSGNFKCGNSSIKTLAKRSKCDFQKLLNGEKSLGYFLQMEGVKTVPSPAFPSTPVNCYIGGHNIRTHGSLHQGGIDAIQIETPKKYRNKQNAANYVKCLAKAIVGFMNEHHER